MSSSQVDSTGVGSELPTNVGSAVPGRTAAIHLTVTSILTDGWILQRTL